MNIIRDIARFIIVTNNATDFNKFGLFSILYVSIEDIINIPIIGVKIREDNNIHVMFKINCLKRIKQNTSACKSKL